MWDNLILEDEKNDWTKLQNIIIQIFLSFEEESVLSVSRKEREKKKKKDHFDQLSGWSFAFCTVL